MSIVMILRGLPDGRTTPCDGEYLRDFDFEAHGGVGEITTTPWLHEAKLFHDFGAALEFTRTSPKCKPIRDDGRPNRPLTASNWEFKNV